MSDRPTYSLGAAIVPLKAAEERALLAIARTNDAARNRVVMAHAGMAMSYAARFRNTHIDVEDLVHEGILGLNLAALRYDPSQGARFATYAVWYVRDAIRVYVQKQTGSVRRPHKGEQTGTQDISLDQPSVNGGSIGDHMVDPAPISDELATKSIDGDRVEGVLMQALEPLDVRERLIVLARHYSAEEWTLQELGDLLNLTRGRVHQIERDALIKLRATFAPLRDAMVA